VFGSGLVYVSSRAHGSMGLSCIMPYDHRGLEAIYHAHISKTRIRPATLEIRKFKLGGSKLHYFNSADNIDHELNLLGR